MFDLLLTMSAVFGVISISTIGILVLPWSEEELRESADAWSTLGRAGVDGVSAGFGALSELPATVRAVNPAPRRAIPVRAG